MKKTENVYEHLSLRFILSGIYILILILIAYAEIYVRFFLLWLFNKQKYYEEKSYFEEYL